MAKFKRLVIKYSDFIRTVVTTEVIFVLVFTLLLANCVVPTASMEPTINTSARVLAVRTSYIKSDPKRGDVIIFNYPDDEKYVFCKRIIGLPGELLEIKNGATYINDKEITEDYIKYSFSGSYGPFYIPAKGDVVEYNKTLSMAFCGTYVVGGSEFVDKYCENIDGKYVVKEDCYFCMGDNRDNSEDSRFWTNKYVIKSAIIGKMWINLSNGLKTVV